MRFVASLASISAVSAFAISKDVPAVIDYKLQHAAESFIEDVQNDFSSAIDKTADFISSSAAEIIHNVEKRITVDFDTALSKASRLGDDLEAFEDEISTDKLDFSNYTIWELISQSNHTDKFASYFKDHKDVIDILNSTEANSTLFVPINEAFEHLPEHEKPSDEYVDEGLRYHIALGDQHTGFLFPTHTLPTALNEKFLGGKPQRLRLSTSLRGVFVNFYSKVVAANFKAKNGYIHAVSKILVRPFMIGRTIALFPSKFSTLLLAYEKTDFVKYVHGLTLEGSTVFVPSNKAWEKLGPKANAFLFYTEEGKKHLTALLKYQIVPNVTLYSDEVYYADKRFAIKDLKDSSGHFHTQLPTLLEKDISVDVYTWGVWTSIVLNGAVGTEVIDAIGKNGVAHVTEYIVIPQGRAGQKLTGEIEVEELKYLLKDYVDADEEIGEL